MLLLRRVFEPRSAVETCLEQGMRGKHLDGVATYRPLIQLLALDPFPERAAKLVATLLDAGANPSVQTFEAALKHHRKTQVSGEGQLDGTGSLRSQVWGYFAALHFDLSPVPTNNAFTCTLLGCERQGISAADSPTFQKLLAAGADVNAFMSDGYTPLLFALVSRDVWAFKFLVALGADLDMRLPLGATPSLWITPAHGSLAQHEAGEVREVSALTLPAEARCICVIAGGISVRQLVWLMPELAQFPIGDSGPPRGDRKMMLWLKGCALGKLRAELSRRGIVHEESQELCEASIVIGQGTTVTLCGLKGAPQHNGKTGRVEAHDEASGRYVVKLSDGEAIRIKAGNLVSSSGLISLLIESITFKDAAKRLAFAIENRNPAAAISRERELKDLRGKQHCRDCIDLRELSLWNKTSYPPSCSMARTLFLAQTSFLNAMSRAEVNYTCDVIEVRNKADYNAALRKWGDKLHAFGLPDWPSLDAQFRQLRAQCSNAPLALTIKTNTLGKEFIEYLTNGLLEHRAVVLSSFRVGGCIPKLDSIEMLTTADQLRPMARESNEDLGGMLAAVQTALNEHIGEITNAAERLCSAQQRKEEGISIPFEFNAGASSDKLAHERAMTDYDMPALVRRIKKTYTLKGGKEHAKHILRVLVRYQIALAWKAALFAERGGFVRLCLQKDVKLSATAKRAGLSFADEEVYWRNAIQLATGAKAALPRITLSVVSETFIRGMRCRLIEALQAKDDGKAHLDELVEQAHEILESVKRSPDGLQGQLELTVKNDPDDPDSDEHRLDIHLLAAEHDDWNGATTWTAIPLATAHLVLAAHVPTLSIEHVLHCIQALMMWPADAMQRPVTAWLLAQNQLEMGASLGVIRASAQLATEVEAEFLKGAFGEAFSEGDVPARDQVLSFLKSNLGQGPDHKAGPSAVAAGLPTLTARIMKLVAAYVMPDRELQSE